jgi:large conductance mechanosensitive channel
MSFLKEFREFLGSGSAVDLAVGVLAAGAIGKILQSFVDELIIPLTGYLGKADLANLYHVTKGSVPEGTPLAEARKIPGTIILGYGQFLTVAVNTIIIVLAVFLVVKTLNALKKKQVEEVAAAPPPAPPAQEVLLTEIRDLLKTK